VKTHHLARFAGVYLRQSSPRQVHENIGSTAVQYDQASYARAFGWPETRIQFFDDLGISGKSVDNRTSYLELVGKISAGLIGALFLAYIDRGGREAIEYMLLFRLCAQHDVLVVVDGRVYDMKHSGSLLLARIQAIIAEHDNTLRTERMQSARRAKAEMGLPVATLPAGYVKLPDGKVQPHPDAAVRSAMRAGIDAVLRCRSIDGAVTELNRRAVKYPRPLAGGGHQFVDWHTSTLGTLITHPINRGELHYPLSKLGPLNAKTGRPKRIATTLEERVIHRGHHPAYISPAEAAEIDEILRLNARKEGNSPIGAGDMILQGMLRCVKHPGIRQRRHLKVHPGWANGQYQQEPYYKCEGDTDTGGAACIFLPSRPVWS
jgi:DNA invertase Pin-like site-specific DNA recombinase